MHRNKISMLRFIEEPNNNGGSGDTPPTDQSAPVNTDQSGKDDDGKGGKGQILADLAKERDKRQELQKQLDDLVTAQAAQRDALATALGVKPEEVSDADKVAADLSDLKAQLGTLQRSNVLLASGIDAEAQTKYAHLLTATDPQALALQAQTVAELVGASATPPPPAFQTLNGQGQQTGNPTPLADQLRAAEQEAAKATPGSAEQKAALARTMQLKSQQLAALKPQQ